MSYCNNCGHPETHHDAGECWTDVAGREVFTDAEKFCRCSWADFSGDDRLVEIVAKIIEAAEGASPLSVARLVVGMLEATGYRIVHPVRRRVKIREQ